MSFRNQAESVLKKFKNKKVLVVGDVGVDRYTFGSVDRISPEAPVPIVFVEEEKLKLGLAANVADNIRELGGEAWLVGVIGSDRDGEDLKDLLKKSKIAPQYLVTESKRRTIIKERILSERQHLLRIDYETTGPISEKSRKDVLKQVASLMEKADAVILQDYHKGFFDRSLIRGIVEEAHRHGKRVLVDPHRATPVEHYQGVDVLTPNRKEAEALSGIEGDPERAGRKLLEMTGAAHVLVTLGKDGMAIHSHGKKAARQIPTVAREVYDVSGAGDTVISVLALALASGAEMEVSAKLANTAAGIEVGKVGTATVSPGEIVHFLKTAD